MPPIPFIGQTYSLTSRNLDSQRTVNLYPVVDETGLAKGQQNPIAGMVGTPGLRSLYTLPGPEGVRGIYATSTGRVFAAQGQVLYEVGLGVVTVRGNLQATSAPVVMADNGRQLAIVDGGYGYIYNLDADTFGQIADPDFTGSDRVAYLDGYFVFNRPGTQIFYVSDLLEGGQYDALNFASAEAMPDLLKSLIVHNRELWLFGDETTEVWFNAGLADFPLARIQGAVIETGIDAPDSVASLGDYIYLLGKTDEGTGQVYRASAYRMERVSTFAIEQALAKMPYRYDAIGYGYQQSGHEFYVLTIPNANQTWVYDATVGLWHERMSVDTNGVRRRHRGNCLTFGFGLPLVGDAWSGAIMAYDQAVYTDLGRPIPRIRTSPHLSGADLNWFFFEAFQLDMETGVGLDGAVSPGADPQVMLEWSDDGGHTWSNEHWVSAGALGTYRTRALWRRLGRGRDRVFRVTITDPVPVTLIGARIQVTEGAA